MRRLGQLPTDYWTDLSGQTPTAGDVNTFSSWYDRFTQIWPAFLMLSQEIQDHISEWSALATERYRAGDIEGFRAAKARVTALTAMESERSTVAATVGKFKDAWDSFRGWITNAGLWAGAGSSAFSGPGLGIAPLALVIGIPALIAAIAWVVNTYLRLRTDLDYDAKLLADVSAGRLTPAQATALQRGGTGAGMTLGGGLGLVALALLALVLLPTLRGR